MKHNARTVVTRTPAMAAPTEAPAMTVVLDEQAMAFEWVVLLVFEVQETNGVAVLVMVTVDSAVCVTSDSAGSSERT
jgi:hypothetical protein